MALGLVAHPGAYLRSPWNQLDAVVVITSIISTASPNNKVGILKALRLLRVLRPLRMISRFKVWTKDRHPAIQVQEFGTSVPFIPRASATC